MKIVLQRVSRASVTVDGKIVRSIIITQELKFFLAADIVVSF